MTSPFQWRIDIPAIPQTSFRIVTYLIVATFMIISMYKQRHAKRKRIYNFVNTFALLTLAHFVYETFWIIGLSPYGSRNEIILFVPMAFILAGITSLLHSWHSFLKLNVRFLLSYGVFLTIFCSMYFTGWFYDLQLWLDGGSSDPEGVLWFASKVLGLLSWTLLVRK